MMNERTRLQLAHAAVALAACMWGTWSLFFRPVEQLARVSAAAETFFIFSTVFLVALPGALRDTWRAQTPPRRLLALGGIGIVDALNTLLFFVAMQQGSLTVAVLTHYLAPLLVALASPLMLRDAIRPSTWAALGLSSAGLCLLLEPWRAITSQSLMAAVYGGASAVFFAANIILTKRVGSWFTHRQLVAWRMPSALLLLWLFVPSGGFSMPWEAAGILAVGALLPGALAATLFYWGLTRIPASRAAVLTLLEPAVAVLIGATVWGEELGGSAGVGILLMLAGAYLTLVPPPAQRVVATS